MTTPPAPVTTSSPAPSPSWFPDRNVLAGGVVAVVSWIIIAVSGHEGLPIPLEFQALIPAALGYIVTYLLPPSVQDVIKRINDAIVRVAARSQSSAVSERTLVLPEAAKVVSVATPGPVVAVPPAIDPNAKE